MTFSFVTKIGAKELITPQGAYKFLMQVRESCVLLASIQFETWASRKKFWEALSEILAAARTYNLN